MFNWNFKLNNKYYSIYLKDYYMEINDLFKSFDKMNWVKIETSDKKKLIHNFMYDNYFFSIRSLNDQKYELFINSISFDYIKQINDNIKQNIDNLNLPTAIFGKKKQNDNDNNINNNINNNNFINNINNNINQNIIYDNLNTQKKEKKINSYNNIINKEHINESNKNNFSNINQINNNNINNNINNINIIEDINNDKIKKFCQTSRNRRPRIEYQSSDELLKKAITKEKKSFHNLGNYYSNESFKSKLPKFAEHLPKSIYHVYQYNNKNMEKECPICLCNFIIGQEIVTLPCFHFFHGNCISKWLNKKRTCPVCCSPIQ